MRPVRLLLLAASLACCDRPGGAAERRDAGERRDALAWVEEDATAPIDGDLAAPLDAGIAPPRRDPDHRPAWLEGQAIGEWRAIPGSSMSLQMPSVAVAGSLSARLEGWCGLSIDDRDATIYSAANGGHTDYSGNEVIAIALHADAPRWVELRAPTPPELIAIRSSHYLDGRPASRESFYGQVFLERRNRAITLGGSYWQGGAGAEVDGFDLARNDWDPAGTFPTAPLRLIVYAWTVAEDDRTGDLYLWNTYQLYRWIDAANRWETIGGSPIYGNYSASATDVARRRILVIEGMPAVGQLYDIVSRTTAPVTLAGAAAVDLGVESALGMVYEPVIDRYLVRRPGAGSTVYAIDGATFAVEILATTGGEAIPAAVNGVYRRFLYAPTLGGVVLYPAYAGDVWFLRTH